MSEKVGRDDEITLTLMDKSCAKASVSVTPLRFQSVYSRTP